jgi:elongation factor Tu
MTGIVARVRFLSSQEGGRRAPVWSGYRPGFWFRDAEGNDGVLEFLDREKAMPGDECEVRITFLHPEFLEGLLGPNKSFDVREGNRLVARGTVLKPL